MNQLAKIELSLLKETKLNDGRDVVIFGEVYDEPIERNAEMDFYNVIRILYADRTLRWIGYYPEKMDQQELQDKLDEIAENINDKFYERK